MRIAAPSVSSRRTWRAQGDARRRAATLLRRDSPAPWELARHVIDGVQGRSTHVTFPDGFDLEAVRRGRTFGITTLENGVHVVDVFRLGSLAEQPRGPGS